MESGGGSKKTERELSLWPLVASAVVLSVVFLGASAIEPPENPAVDLEINGTALNGTVANGTSISGFFFGFPANTFIDDFIYQFAFSVELGSLFGLWYIFNIYFNIYNKQLLNVFPYPLTVTTVQFAVGGLFSLSCWGTGLYPHPLLMDDQVLQIIPVAVFHAFGNVFTNMSVKEVNVSFTHVIKSLEPFVSVVLTFFLLHKSPTVLVVSSLLPTVGGVALASVSEISFNWLGFWSAMASNITFQTRNVLSKQILMATTEGFDNINLFSVITLQSFLIVLPFALLCESPSSNSKALQMPEFDIRKAVTRGGFAAICFHAYQQVSYMILQRVTPVTHSVGNCMKRLVVIVTSVVFFRTPVSNRNATGIALALFGVFLYSQVKGMK